MSVQIGVPKIEATKTSFYRPVEMFQAYKAQRETKEIADHPVVILPCCQDERETREIKESRDCLG